VGYVLAGNIYSSFGGFGIQAFSLVVLGLDWFEQTKRLNIDLWNTTGASDRIIGRCMLFC
jgi:hypothetical protein